MKTPLEFMIEALASLAQAAAAITTTQPDNTDVRDFVAQPGFAGPVVAEMMAIAYDQALGDELEAKHNEARAELQASLQKMRDDAGLDHGGMAVGKSTPAFTTEEIAAMADHFNDGPFNGVERGHSAEEIHAMNKKADALGANTERFDVV